MEISNQWVSFESILMPLKFDFFICLRQSAWNRKEANRLYSLQGAYPRLKEKENKL